MTDQSLDASVFFLFVGSDEPLPSAVFHQAEDEWMANELCKLFNAEYGQTATGFRWAKLSPTNITEIVLFQSAIDGLALYQDPDPGIYDPRPTPDLLQRANFFFRAQEWEDLLKRLRAYPKT